jgi:SulP family sulfate permease
MAMESIVTERPLAGASFNAAVEELFAGTVSSTLTIAFCLSYAALIFSGSLTPWLAYGISLSCLSAAVCGLVVSWRARCRLRLPLRIPPRQP